MKVYITIVLCLSLVSFMLNRVVSVMKSEKASAVSSHLIGVVLEIGMVIAAIIFTWRL